MLGWFLSPLAWLLIATVLVLWAGHRRRRRLVAAGVAMIAIALAAMTPLGANLLAMPLERAMPVPRACIEAPPSTAVVLGGGMEGRPRGDADFSVLNLPSRRRMDRALAWWRERGGRVLVLQGGSPHRGAVPVARLMAAYAQAQGVPATALRIDTASGDTWESAQHAARLSPRLPQRIELVTSRVHMPRAQRAFAVAGFAVCPMGADDRRLPSRLPWALVPRSSALIRTEGTLHEWVGLAYYRWRARHEVDGAK
ncbi:YdcF family protein [Montanilutibacter psychrotolerans]|uniref:YdcF family protein n=1 Tax=Montanilutibacter psychrotolerans TaxID=1327343 RepID=A0A3M8SR88_9GAMM|nr:YdcF family protein [Lysobacter psychrotolerans]RNF83283.1 YdcF family protein [Lysobacter psychrotolerans]